MSHNEHTGARKGSWLKRIGLAGFLFFLVKGLVWLAIFAGAGTLFAC
ncbi:MAG: hypothetical protein KF797_04370 [Flavobacteriales bacterium]|nr:hypothetical protein [Flavobacteriales bacterium]